MASLSRTKRPIHLGLHVHKDSISAAILDPDSEVADIERIFHDETSVRRLVGRFAEPRELRACYEAGPTGYELHRLLISIGVRCQVIAPSLILKAPGDRIKTGRRDARRLARLHRAGELPAIRVPSPLEEAVRDLCRARDDAVADRTRARHRLSKFLLRHGLVWRGGNQWTLTTTGGCEGSASTSPPCRRRSATTWRSSRSATPTCARSTPISSRGSPRTRSPSRSRDSPPIGGIDQLGALTLASEVCDWRRFASAQMFMGFCGLVRSEYSTGESTRRGRITKAGNAHLRRQLVESAWSYRFHPGLTDRMRWRHEGLTRETAARSWAAQLRLCSRFRRLATRKESKAVVARAIARELAGFLWAEMTA